jgi:3-methyl-2-oxobutanoate hydroxymethyltransferase
MSVHSQEEPRRVLPPDLARFKTEGRRVTMVTAYDYPSGQLADQAGVDVVLVGDSAAMVVLGYESTVPVTVDELLVLTAAARRGAPRPLLVGDLPFGSYHASHEDAMRTAIRFVKEAGVDAVKLEGAGPMVERIRRMVDAGVPVMGHLGLTPQTAAALGGFKAQARTAERAATLLGDALLLEEAGCFAVVLEAVPAAVAQIVSERMTIPTIGIGAGAGTDGQVLVWHDMFGLFDRFTPKFVKRYGELRPAYLDGLRAYVDDVRSGAFPGPEHSFTMKVEELETFRRLVRPAIPTEGAGL